MILGIELMSFWCADEDAIKRNEEFDIPIPEEALTLKAIMFYNIDNVKPNGEHMSYVSSGGEDFCINESYDSVNRKIQERLTFKFN